MILFIDAEAMLYGATLIDHSDGEMLAIAQIDNGVILTGNDEPWLTRANAAQLWPIIKHYAETGELCEVPPVAEDAPLGVAELGNRVAMLIEYAQKLEFRILALEQDHLPGRMHRANESHAFGAVPVCVCGHEYDKHFVYTTDEGTRRPCECCGCANFQSAELRYMEAT